MGTVHRNEMGLSMSVTCCFGAKDRIFRPLADFKSCTCLSIDYSPYVLVQNFLEYSVYNKEHDTRSNGKKMFHCIILTFNIFKSHLVLISFP